MSLSLTILFCLIWEEQQAPACRMSVIDGHKDDDEGDFALLFQVTSMISDKWQFLVRCQDSTKVPQRLKYLGNGKYIANKYSQLEDGDGVVVIGISWGISFDGCHFPSNCEKEMESQNEVEIFMQWIAIKLELTIYNLQWEIFTFSVENILISIKTWV